jgi:hypothetical protein
MVDMQGALVCEYLPGVLGGGPLRDREAAR